MELRPTAEVLQAADVAEEVGGVLGNRLSLGMNDIVGFSLECCYQAKQLISISILIDINFKELSSVFSDSYVKSISLSHTIPTHLSSSTMVGEQIWSTSISA